MSTSIFRLNQIVSAPSYAKTERGKGMMVVVLLLLLPMAAEEAEQETHRGWRGRAKQQEARLEKLVSTTLEVVMVVVG